MIMTTEEIARKRLVKQLNSQIKDTVDEEAEG